jgi:hypothetical protein
VAATSGIARRAEAANLKPAEPPGADRAVDRDEDVADTTWLGVRDLDEGLWCGMPLRLADVR